MTAPEPSHSRLTERGEMEFANLTNELLRNQVGAAEHVEPELILGEDCYTLQVITDEGGQAWLTVQTGQGVITSSVRRPLTAEQAVVWQDLLYGLSDADMTEG
jgi:hypothetical protein